jgi:hypothetical protein
MEAGSGNGWAAPTVPAETTGVTGRRWSAKKWLLVVGGVAVLAVIGFSIDEEALERDERAAARPSLRSLIRDVCPSQSACGIDVRTVGPPWRFELDGDATADGVAALGIWARETGCLEEVDFDRMAQTRALDGMVESMNGRATWTYHPDDGLVIVCG